MKSIRTELSRRIAGAIAAMGAQGDPQLGAASDERFGDFQSNCAMALARELRRKPREIAAEIVERLEIDDLAEPAEIAGAGFINFRLWPQAVAAVLEQVPAAAAEHGNRLGIPRASASEIVAVDLSSPNLAKEMHVGHLRSTVIGDAVSRILEFQGHHVLRENHVGDWGTQFGMLLAHLRRTRPEILDDPDSLVIQDLETFYVEAKRRFDKDPAFKKEAQETVVALQRGEESARRIWRAFCNESLRHCHEIYRRLDVELVDRGESSYNDLMPEVIRRLSDGGHVVESDGALVMFLEGFSSRDGEPLPLIVRKADGGYNYATSDLATLVHRIETEKATRILYVVGVPQKLHFEMLFAAARKAGIAGPDVSLTHLGFGHMLGPDGKPFKTREGGTVKLKFLLDEAVARARDVLENLGGEGAEGGRGRFTPEQMTRISETVGIAAVKYFDLSHSLVTDYKFDLAQMVSLEGNTAPYMLYAYARIRSIGRKSGTDLDELGAGAIVLEHPSEIALGKALARFVDVLDQLGRDLRPNGLTDYLYKLSRTFSRFYDRKLGVRIIDASPESLRLSRLRLCSLTARTLRLGLSLLGIETVEEM